MGITAPPGDWSGSGYTFNNNIGRTNYQNPPPPAPQKEPPPPEPEAPPAVPLPPPKIEVVPLPIDQSSILYTSMNPAQVRRLE